jgi:HK97 family phage prohead protease/HK97 family phage major capsid protein
MPMKPSQSDIIYKTHVGSVRGLDFVLSDETRDRMNDIILSSAWQLDEFKSNPIALFNHSPSAIIGTWGNVRIEEQSLRGELELAAEGTSDRIDEIRKLIDAGILKAASVGFRPLESEPIDTKDPYGGSIYKRCDLVEVSVVAVPANPQALAVAKSLNISADTLDFVFAGQGNEDGTKRRIGVTGGQAETSRNGKGSAMSLAQRIIDVEAAINDRKDKLTAHLAKLDDSNVSDADMQKSSDWNAEIARLAKTRDTLIDSEKLLGKTAEDGNGIASRSLALFSNEQQKIGSPAIIIDRKKDMSALDYYSQTATVALRAKQWGRPPDETQRKIYGDNEELRIAYDLLVRAASAPALTTVTGWAKELVQPRFEALMPLLMPKAILTRLAARGMTLDFGTAGQIIIPTRSRTPTIAGSFVGEGNPIPVRQGAFTSQTITPKKLGVISLWSQEMQDYSTPAIEGVIREAMQTDTSVAVDTVLIDANAATTVRPAGLLNGVAALTATAGGGIAAILGDIKQLVGALSSATYGNLRSLIWLMNPTDMLTLSLATAANTGVFPFRDQIERNTFANIPVIDSATVPAKTVILLDAADFVTAGAGAPTFLVSDQATVHLEDTSPQQLATVGTPNVVAAPQQSLFQTDSLGLRMTLRLNWILRRTGVVAWTSNVTW